jgi:DNA repair exonuclease SbcCD ATPase subunit
MEVYINNFRGIKEERYQFSKGTNLLKGESGVGKTTIFEAIKWGLYGNMKDILPWDELEGKAKIKVEIKIDGYTITRTNRPSVVTVISSSSDKRDRGSKKYTGDEAPSKIRELFGTKALWETCSYLGQDQRNFILQASQREKTEIIKELLFDITSEESEWYKDKFERFKESLRLKNAEKSGKIDNLREEVDEDQEKKPSVKELKKAKKREQDLLLYDKVDKKYKKACVKIDEYEKFKEMKFERDKMEKKLSLYPFPISWKKMQKWEEYSSLRKEWSELKNKKLQSTDLTREEILLQKKSREKNNKILQIFELENGEEIKKLYKQIFNKLKNRELVSIRKREKVKRKKLRNKLSSQINDLEDVEEEMDDVRSRRLFSEVSDRSENLSTGDESENLSTGDGFSNLSSVDERVDPKKCNVLISKYEEIKEAKVRECPACKVKLVLDEHGELNLMFSGVKGRKSADKKITLLEWMMDVDKRYSKSLMDIELTKREISELPDPSEKEEENDSDDQEIDYDQLEEECQMLSKFDHSISEMGNIQPMLDFLRNKEIEKRIEQVRFPDADYQFPTFPCELGDTPEEYVEEYREAKSGIEKYDKFAERYEIIDEGVYMEKIEKRDTMKVELDKLDRVKDVLKHGQIREHLLEVGKNNQMIGKASVLADRIESLVNQNLQLFLTDFNNLINDMISYLIGEMSITLSLFKTTKVTKKTKCNVNVEINFKGHKINNYSVLSGGQKDRLSLVFTLVFAKICNARFIFLDEFMSSLDEDLRNKCLDLVKSLGGDMIMVNVCHETVEGCYDRVISI